GKHTIRVRLDEKVGHNTQGFLPIIQPHFGGLWQEVKLIELPDIYIDDLRLSVVADPKDGQIRFTAPVVGREKLNGQDFSYMTGLYVFDGKTNQEHIQFGR